MKLYNIILLLGIYLSFSALFTPPTYALSCKSITGQVNDARTSEGIPDVTIIFYVNGQQLVNTTNTQNKLDLNLDPNNKIGKFYYIWPIENATSITASFSQSNYKGKTVDITNCDNNIINLEPAYSPGQPSPTRGPNSSCGGLCAGPEFCQGDDGCTACIAGYCRNPDLAAPTPDSSTGCNACGWCYNNYEKKWNPKDKPKGYDLCEACVMKGKTGSWTALGCVDTTPNGFVSWLLTGAIGIGGGIAFLIMLWGVFTIITASGNPDRLNQGREIIVSAIVGLLMIIFAIFLLRIIGVKILQIPGFG